jgi:hypothetical protein
MSLRSIRVQDFGALYFMKYQKFKYPRNRIFGLDNK